jgi:hypothetical protein
VGRPGAGSRRRRTLVGLAAAAALAALFAARSGPGVEAAPPARRAASDAPAPAAAPPGPGPGPAAGASGLAALEPEALPEPVRRLLESTPYPDGSGRLTPAHEDLLHPNRRYERPRPIPDTLGADPGEVVTWLFTADRYAYLGPDVAHVWLEVQRGGRPLSVELLEATATREGRAGPTGGAQALDFRAEGEGRLAADLALDRFADHHGPIVLAVRFEYAPGRTHEDTLRLFHTPSSRIPGRLGPLRDRLHEGSLRLELEVELARAGFYRFDANVYDASGQPVAFVAFKGELEPGPQVVPLDVYGKVLRDAGAPGPYEVGEIRGYRFLDGQYPDREHLAGLPERHQTAAYALEAFTDTPFVSEHELRLVDLMLDDLERGIGLAVPPLPQDATPGPRPADDDFEPIPTAPEGTVELP